MYRTFVILRHTFREAIVQPIYTLLMSLAAAILVVFSLLPFFTLGEDTVMYKSVSLDVILLFVLIATLFACSRSIYDEIEDRTMLTLMSKPVTRFEVLLGKYLGIVLSTLVAVIVLGAVLAVATYLRVPGDYQLNTNSIDERDVQTLSTYRTMHVLGVIPEMVLKWLQISVLAAVGVAISTRVSLVVNLPVVILLYIARNLTRFLFPLDGQSALAKGVAYVVSSVLPYLENFDLTSKTVYSRIAVGQFATDPAAVSLGAIWGYVAAALAYAACYVFFALMFGLFLFQNRELGGAEG